MYLVKTSFSKNVLDDVLIEGCWSVFDSSRILFFRFLIFLKRSSQLLAYGNLLKVIFRDDATNEAICGDCSIIDKIVVM